MSAVPVSAAVGLAPGSPAPIWPASVAVLTPAMVAAAIQRAEAAGALATLATDVRRIADGGVTFVVRSVSSLALKEARQSPVSLVATGPAAVGGANPFLPYEPALEVAGLGDGHVCLLNRFNVVAGHLLIVTRDFAAQETLLDRADFTALWRVLAGIDGLGFYNAGPGAGASQPHKHFQVVPLPLLPPDRPGDPPLPIAPLIAAVGTGGGCLPGLPFRHAFARLDPDAVDPTRGADPAAFDPAPAAAAALACYHALLAAAGIAPQPGSNIAAAPYNLLVTRDWMLVVPRRREAAAGIAVNALGFAGSLFVRDRDQLATVERLGPMALLTAVAVPLAEADDR